MANADRQLNWSGCPNLALADRLRMSAVARLLGDERTFDGARA
jgi:hypothetical protein